MIISATFRSLAVNKRTLFITLSFWLVLSLLGVSAPVRARAQSNPLICDQFTGGSADVRVSYYMGEGIGYFASGNFSQALDSFSCVIDQIDPNYVPAYMSRAAVYAQFRSYDKSIDDYNTALRLSPNFTPAYNNRGIIHAAQTEFDLALADFSQAITLDSAFVLGYNNRAVIYAIQARYDEAIADLNQAISLSGIGRTLAEVSDPQRDPDTPWPSIRPTDALSFALLGIVYEMQARDNYTAYLTLMRGSADSRIESASGALESRFTFELRLDDGTWLYAASFSPAG
jgi:tetratricopeptide (TPR) repeat protein